MTDMIDSNIHFTYGQMGFLHFSQRISKIKLASAATAVKDSLVLEIK